MDVLVTRYIGIRGTAILSREYFDDLIKRYPKALVDEACKFDENIDSIDDTSVISDDIVYISEYTEFGIFEALFQMSKKLKCGLRINIKDIPIKQETIEICEFTGVNPYALYSGKSYTVVSKNGNATKELFEKNGIPAEIVGHTTEDNDKILINEQEEAFLPHIRKDELKAKLGRKVYYERTDSVNTREEQ